MRVHLTSFNFSVNFLRPGSSSPHLEQGLGTSFTVQLNSSDNQSQSEFPVGEQGSIPMCLCRNFRPCFKMPWYGEMPWLCKHSEEGTSSASKDTFLVLSRSFTAHSKMLSPWRQLWTASLFSQIHPNALLPSCSYNICFSGWHWYFLTAISTCFSDPLLLCFWLSHTPDVPLAYQFRFQKALQLWGHELLLAFNLVKGALYLVLNKFFPELQDNDMNY